MKSRESDKRDLDPNATIQLDALEGVQLEDIDAPPAIEPHAGMGRGTPPPLPVAPSNERPLGKTLFYVALSIALLAAAIAAGLTVGSVTRAKLARTPVPSGTAVATTSTPTAAPASASARTLTLPTIEIK